MGGMNPELAAERRANPGWEGHGTLTGYVKAKCRCERCCARSREYARERTEWMLRRPIPEHFHGTTNAYSNFGCRCEPCKLAHRRQNGR